MANSALLPLEAPLVFRAKRIPTAPDANLAGVAAGQTVHVTELALDADLAQWLRAVGIGEGDELVVLRRAAFGGPLHVRTRSGGEFALNAALARSIVIRAVEKGEESAA